ncbi:HXXEE domain-containing protein [Desulfosporosinus nitroreducens]|nr:HXXEE domain-containing protein [Desulfosporosinus nitroreducens]
MIRIEFWSIYLIVWLFPVLFLIHDLEEILTVKGFMNRNKDRIVSLLSPKIGTFVQKQFDLTTVQFSVSVAFVFIFVISSTYLTTHYNFAEGALRYFFIIVAIFFVHVFTHVGQALILRTYTPGVITSVLIVFPYTSYVIFRLLREHIIDWNFALANIPFVLLALPIILGAHSIARRLVK